MKRCNGFSFRPALGAPLIAGLAFSMLVHVLCADEVKPFPSAPPDAETHARLASMWDMDNLLLAPDVWAVSEAVHKEQIFPEGKLTPLFYAGLPFRGEPTRVFAWLGMPTGADPGHPVPGIVLVHGGGGTAFRDWAQLWVKRGYAVIAMDIGENIPATAEGFTPALKRHDCRIPGHA